MYVSLSTVKTHLGSIQLKLSARNRVEIAAWAWQSGTAGPRS
jgi:DNA-binding CsgD family transcriptional regulator